MLLLVSIRMIYGDAITPEITEKVCSWCVRNNISVSNLCFGIGAYTYQYVTRDTRGYAIKATDCILGNDEIQIYKMPKTDPGKKSPRGCVAIFKEENGNYSLVENLTLEGQFSYSYNGGALWYCDNHKVCLLYTSDAADE